MTGKAEPTCSDHLRAARARLERACKDIRQAAALQPSAGRELGRMHVQLLDLQAALREMETNR